MPSPQRRSAVEVIRKPETAKKICTPCWPFQAERVGQVVGDFRHP